MNALVNNVARRPLPFVRERPLPSLWPDCVVWATLPVSMNVLRILDPNGSKILAVLALFALMLKNLLLLPATSVWGFGSVYSRKLKDVVPLRALLAIYLLVQLLVIANVRALGEFYTITNVVANIAVVSMGPAALLLSFLAAGTVERCELIFKSFLIGFPLFVMFNILLYAVGIRGLSTDIDDAGANQMLGMVGLHVGRALFAMSNGKNGMGSLAAIGMIVSMFLFFRTASVFSRIVYAALAFLSLAAVALIDSRAALAYTVGTLLIVAFTRKSARKLGWWKWSILSFPLVPLFAVWLFDFLNRIGGLSILVRGGAAGARLGVGTGRGAVWGAVLSRLEDPEWIDLVGYGAFGHVASKVSAAYAWVFNSLGSTINGAHNSFLQYVLDCGYLGGIAWLFLLFVIFSQLHALCRQDGRLRGMSLLTLSLAMFTYFQTQTEPFATLYAPEALMLVFSLCLFSGVLLKRPQAS